MPFVRTYFEDDGGTGPRLSFSGFGEPVELVRGSALARAVPGDELGHIYVDHRGHGRSDKPHNPENYSIRLRAGDAVAVLDELEA